MPNIKTFIANVKQAIRNRETVTIAGGEFDREELAQVVAVLEAMPGLRDALKDCITAPGSCALSRVGKDAPRRLEAINETARKALQLPGILEP